MRDKVLAGPLDGDLDPFARPSRGLSNALSRRIDADPESVEQGLAQLVLTIVELLRQLMERQALRRIDGGGLTEEQIERLGTTFMELDRRMEELRDHFGLDGRGPQSRSGAARSPVVSGSAALTTVPRPGGLTTPASRPRPPRGRAGRASPVPAGGVGAAAPVVGDLDSAARRPRGGS